MCAAPLPWPTNSVARDLNPRIVGIADSHSKCSSQIAHVNLVS